MSKNPNQKVPKPRRQVSPDGQVSPNRAAPMRQYSGIKQAQVTGDGFVEGGSAIPFSAETRNRPAAFQGQPAPPEQHGDWIIPGVVPSKKGRA